MILLLVSETEVSHVLAENFDAVRVLPTGCRPANFLNTGYYPKGNIYDHWRIAVIRGVRAEVQAIVCNGQRPDGGLPVRADVGHIVLLVLFLFAIQVDEGSLARYL